MSPPHLKLGPDSPDGQPNAEILESRLAYEDFVRVEDYQIRVRNFNGTWSDPYKRRVVSTGESGEVAAVLPYDPERDVVVLIEQFRMPALAKKRQSAWMLEAAAGLIAPGDSPENAAHRELAEETGRSARRLEKVGEFFSSPGVFSEILYCYIAEVAAGKSNEVHGLEHENENIRVHVLTVEDALKLADSGAIEDLKTLFLLNWLARHHDSLRHRWLSAETSETEVGC